VAGRRPAGISSYLGGAFVFRACRRYSRRIYFRGMPKRPKGLRNEHPRLLCLSEAENGLLERAARQVGAPTNVYIREAALFQAREELGVQHPEGA
jgi:hypothetical protein